MTSWRTPKRGTPTSVPPTWVMPRLTRRRAVVLTGLIGACLVLLPGAVVYWLAPVFDTTPVHLLRNGRPPARTYSFEMQSIGFAIRDAEGGVRVVLPSWHSMDGVDSAITMAPEIVAGVRRSIESRRVGITAPWYSEADVRVEVEEYQPGTWSDDELAAARRLAALTMGAEFTLDELESINTGAPVTRVRGGAIARDAVYVAAIGALTTLLVWGVYARARAPWVRSMYAAQNPLECIGCGYGLDGLPAGTPECPECGARLYPSRGPWRNLPR